MYFVVSNQPANVKLFFCLTPFRRSSETPTTRLFGHQHSTHMNRMTGRIHIGPLPLAGWFYIMNWLLTGIRLADGLSLVKDFPAGLNEIACRRSNDPKKQKKCPERGLGA
jgi:hypothetical protein